MYTTLYSVWRPKNILVLVVVTLTINAVLFMGLPVLTRIADRERDTRKDTQYMITPRDAPKPHEEQKEKILRQKELKQIPRKMTTSVSQQKSEPPRFVFDTSVSGVGGLEVTVTQAERMDIDVGDLTFSIEDVDAPPRVIRAPPVNPPYEAISKGLTGRVIVRVRVGTDGKATNIKAIRAEPPEVLEIFAEAAEKGVAKYRFEPARLGGETVPVWAVQPISFELR